MKYAKVIFLGVGILLLGVVLSQANFEELRKAVAQLGVAGFASILAVYCLYFWADAVSWLICLKAATLSPLWIARCMVVRMIGEAYNNITPMASVGGEPIKAWLLKHNYGVPLTVSGTSLITAKTASMFSLAVFVFIGFVFTLNRSDFPSSYKWIASAGLFYIVLSVVVFYCMQTMKLSTFTATKLGHTRFGGKLARLVGGAKSMDAQFADFYANERPRFFHSALWAMLNWILGVVELYVILYFIGYPVSWTEAWIIEAMMQLARTALFFLPAGIGAQEGALFLAFGGIVGNPTLGIAVALIRRGRELTWISLSLLLAAFYRVSPRVVAATE